MQSKEEIEKDRKSYKECIERLKAIGDNNLSLFANNIYNENIEAIRFLFNKYVLKVEQLETEKQELIEKLEEDVKQHTFSDIEVDAIGSYAEEILKILKGENDDRKNKKEDKKI